MTGVWTVRPFEPMIVLTRFSTTACQMASKTPVEPPTSEMRSGQLKAASLVGQFRAFGNHVRMVLTSITVIKLKDLWMMASNLLPVEMMMV